MQLLVAKSESMLGKHKRLLTALDHAVLSKAMARFDLADLAGATLIHHDLHSAKHPDH